MFPISIFYFLRLHFSPQFSKVDESCISVKGLSKTIKTIRDNNDKIVTDTEVAKAKRDQAKTQEETKTEAESKTTQSKA